MMDNVDNTSPQLTQVSIANKTSKLTENILSVMAKIASKISGLFSRAKKDSFENPYFANSRRGGEKNLKKYIPYAILGIFVLALLGVVGGSIFSLIKNFPSKTSAISLADAKARQELNRELAFPFYDVDGKEVSKMKFVILSAELRDELIVNGKRARSVQGRTFLILNLRLTNDHNQSVTINTKDYIRLSVNGSGEWVAPEVHNDPVEVQAIATKPTRLGFAINNSDKNLKLRVGEINGNKEEITLELK